MTFEEWWDNPEQCIATPDTYKGWEQSCHAAWKEGAASRDAEVAELRQQVTLLRDVLNAEPVRYIYEFKDYEGRTIWSSNLEHNRQVPIATIPLYRAWEQK